MTLVGSHGREPMKATYQYTEIPMHPESSTAKHRILRNVARIGSQTFQERVCLRGTSSDYVLLDELIETTISGLEHEITNDVLKTKWSLAERDALQGFVDHVNQLFDQIAWHDESLTLPAIVNEHPSMQLIRDAANECLGQVQASSTAEELLAN